MSWNTGLDKDSLRIATTEASPLRVLAGPGTGKTFTLIRRVARLLENGVSPKQILVSTFTRTAAGDLRHELKRLNANGASSVRSTTIHALCFNILSRNEVLDITGRVPRPLLEYENRFLLEDLKDGDFGNIHQRRKRLKAFEAAWARLQSEQPGWASEPVDQRFEKDLREWLTFHKAMLIGELVPEALRYLRNNPASPDYSAFSHVLIDEYQDLNAAEQEFIQLIAKESQFTIIGDEDQSIYSFKHANPEGIANFKNRHPDTADENLNLCRRCPPNIVEIANRLIAYNQNRTNNRVLRPKPGTEDAEFRVVQWQSMEEEAQGLATFIDGKVQSGDIRPGAVLVLAPRRQFGYAIRDELKGKGIQAHSFFQEQELDGDPKKLTNCQTQQAFTLLTLSAKPDDNVALRCWCGFGDANLAREPWNRIRKLCVDNDLSLKDTLSRLKAGQLNVPGTKKIIDRLKDLEIKLQMLAPLRGQELLDALFPIDDDKFGMIRAMAQDIDPAADAEKLLEVLRTKVTQPELPTDVDYVRIMSLHKSKGLTADMVIVMGCVEDLIPNLGDLSGVAIEEQRRLFYVSITRARKVLVLSSITGLPRELAHKMRVGVRGRRNHAQTITSRFIDELGPTCPRPISGAQLSRGDSTCV